MAKNEEVRSTLAARLRLAREQAGLSQGQVAKQLGFHRPTISEIEAGRRRVSADEVADFARIYDVDLFWLVDDDQKENGPDSSKIQLAARELAKLKREDVDSILKLLRMLRKTEEPT